MGVFASSPSTWVLWLQGRVVGGVQGGCWEGSSEAVGEVQGGVQERGSREGSREGLGEKGDGVRQGPPEWGREEGGEDTPWAVGLPNLEASSIWGRLNFLGIRHLEPEDFCPALGEGVGARQSGYKRARSIIVRASGDSRSIIVSASGDSSLGAQARAEIRLRANHYVDDSIIVRSHASIIVPE